LRQHPCGWTWLRLVSLDCATPGASLGAKFDTPRPWNTLIPNLDEDASTLEHGAASYDPDIWSISILATDGGACGPGRRARSAPNSSATMRCCACCSCAQRGPRQSGPVTDVTGRASWRGRASRRKVFLPGILSVVELWRYQKPCTAMADASYCRAEPKPCGDQAAAATGPGARTPSFAARSGHGL
jgi:hypothetical protein